LEQGKASCGVARQHTGSGPLAAGLDPVGARSPIAGSACTRPMFRGTVMALSSGPCICPRPGPRIRCVGLRCTYRRRLPLRPSRTLHVPWSSGPSRRGCRSPGWPAAGDNIHGVSEVERTLRRAGKGYVPGVSAINQFNSWGSKPPIAGTAAAIADTLDPSAGHRLSAGPAAKAKGCSTGPIWNWPILRRPNTTRPRPVCGPGAL
jgi:hypothetical protein